MTEGTSKLCAFLSYRTESGAVYAELIHDYLERNRIPSFLDADTLHRYAGRFPEELRSSISAADDFILILSPLCLDGVTGENSVFVREILFALEKGKNIIPIACGNFRFPEVLPPGLEILREYTQLALKSISQSGDLFFEALLSKMTQNLPVTDAYDRNFVRTVLESRAAIEARNSLKERMPGDVTAVDMCAMACQGFLSHARERIIELAGNGCRMRFVMNRPHSPAAEEAACCKISSGSLRMRRKIIPNCFDDLTDWMETYPLQISGRVTDLFLPCAIFIIHRKDERLSSVKVDYYAFNCGDTERRSVLIPAADRDNYDFYLRQFEWIWANAREIDEELIRSLEEQK